MCNELDSMFKPIVLVTGFAPYDTHPLNASWEAVRVMNRHDFEKKNNVDLVQIELSVTYKDVDRYVPALWETHTPKLMVHVGMSGSTDCIDLECLAHRKGYQKPDDFGNCPDKNACTKEGAVKLQTKLDVEKICKEFNENSPAKKITTRVSNDAGRFLCEYIYYKSLSIDNTRTLFIHVPPIDVYCPPDVARGIERIIELCLQQIDEREAENVTEDLKKTSVEDEEKI